MPSIVGKRLKAARERAGLTQKELSDRMGFKDRQTVATIESGQRKVSADELIAAMGILGCDLEYFTDPFRLDGEGKFSWRTDSEDVAAVEAFESLAGRWLATYREFLPDVSARTAPLGLHLTAKSSYGDAHIAGEWLVREWELGERPATVLEDAIQKRLQALVLYVDAPDDVSGAAFKLPELGAILINRNEPVGRRSFDLAHELFHLLTWETMPPAHAESSLAPGGKAGRVEQLANCFASALLMPEPVMRDLWCTAPGLASEGLRAGLPAKVAPGSEAKPWDGGQAWEHWLNESACNLRVSTLALQWRFVQLELMAKDAVDDSIYWDGGAVPERKRTSRTGGKTSGTSGKTQGAAGQADGTASSGKCHNVEEEKPELFNRAFVSVLNRAIGEGRISVRRAAALVEMSIDEMADLFERYSIELAFEV